MGAALSFAGGDVARPEPTRSQLESFAGEWFEKALEAFGLAAVAMANGDAMSATTEMAHAERCSARARLYLAEASKLEIGAS